MTSDENATPETEAEDQINPDQTEAALEDRLALLEQENTELREKMLRVAADMENLRKRTEREIADTRAYAISGFARDMLVATDNLSRALMVVPAEARESAEGTLKSLLEGIDMTEREMQRLLQKNGVTPIIALGEKFDPHRHQAMFEIPDTTVAEGTVLQVVQEGYAIGERVLRPAMVGVAKGGAKRAAEPARSDETPDADGIDKSV